MLQQMADVICQVADVIGTIYGVKYHLIEKHVDDLSLYDTSTHSEDHDLSHCKLDIA